MTTVWLVAKITQEWYEVKHICKTREIAVERWEELKTEMLIRVQEMIEYVNTEYKGVGVNGWLNDELMLMNLKPGEHCRCDHPDLKEWDLEEIGGYLLISLETYTSNWYNDNMGNKRGDRCVAHICRW